MKNLKNLTALFLGILFTSFSAIAQESLESSEKNGKANVLIIKDENGKVTEFKKEFDLKDQEELKRFLDEKGVELDLQELINPPSEEGIHKLFKDDDSSRQMLKVIRFDSDEYKVSGEEDGLKKEFRFVIKDSGDAGLEVREFLDGNDFEIELENVMGRLTEDGEIENVRSFVFIKRTEDGDKSGLKSSQGIEKQKLEKLPIEELKIYPNPSQGQVTAEFKVMEPSNVKITVTDVKGSQLFIRELVDFSGVYKDQIDLSAEESGLYFLNIQIGEQLQSNKILLQ